MDEVLDEQFELVLEEGVTLQEVVELEESKREDHVAGLIEVEYRLYTQEIHHGKGDVEAQVEGVN